MGAPETLALLFDAERNVRTLHAELAKAQVDVVLPAIERAITESLALSDHEEAALRQVRCAELLGEMKEARAIDKLIDLMGEGEPEARIVAGEALQELGYSRFKDVALGVERALARLAPASPALSEIPYMLAEIPEPGVMVLLKKFLQRKDAESVAAAIEALAEVGDPEAIPMLEPLEKDKRVISMDELEEGTTITIGELAAEAIDLLERVAE